MAWRKKIQHAAALLSRAEAAADQVSHDIDTAGERHDKSGLERRREQCAAIRTAADRVCSGWLSAEGGGQTVPREKSPESGAVCLGTAGSGDLSYPVLVDLLGSGHLAVDADVSDPRVSGLVQSLIVRLTAAYPAIDFSLVDGTTLGQVFTPLGPLVEAGVADAVVSDALGFGTVLNDLERHIAEVRDVLARGESIEALGYRVLVVAGMPPQVSKTMRDRLAAIVHAGVACRTHVIVCGWRGGHRAESMPILENTALLRVGDEVTMNDVADPIRLERPLEPTVVRSVVAARAAELRQAATPRLSDVVSEEPWEESSAEGLTTPVGRDVAGPVALSFDDTTPHWWIAGRTGSGKTVFLLDALHGLASRYSPGELELYLLDFKEGVSFHEFIPSDSDPTWIPQVKAVGVESDRQYGLAVLERLRRELSRRAGMMKRAGATNIARLRRLRPETSIPRIVAVIDEFHVLLAGNDSVAREATAHLEELARKGRSYGIHLVLASQSVAGVETLYAKKDSIFGQFPMRIALPGAKQVLDQDNNAADTLTVGQAVVNDSAGISGRNRVVSFPDATADEEHLAELRRRWWQARDDDRAPLVFRGFDEQHLADDPRYRNTEPGSPPRALLGRAVDVDLSTVGFEFDSSPGRHVAVVGTHSVASDVVVSAALSVARTARPGEIEFHIASHAAGSDAAVDELKESLTTAGHTVATLDMESVLDNPSRRPRYVVWFGADGAGGSTLRLRRLLEAGPAENVHLLGWWRGARKFLEDLGGSAKRELCAGLVLLNVSAQDADALLGETRNSWEARTNRCLVVDRHAGIKTLAVPFVKPGRLDEFEEA
ncbi:FtsK/SpoIIIE domain-containing protein [Haloglycomyces albus]|uniref:FtsK/SpoIIIE domain-containing protein n=1 Tax=Haloglycomyces albus TaxID=526067 RepID=UPI0004AF49B9|nr:FtsK/SpoIIIE domain-containing protein [Haloglycomyces albus]